MCNNQEPSITVKDFPKHFCTGLRTEDALAQLKWREINIMGRETELFKEKKIKTNKNKSAYV